LLRLFRSLSKNHVNPVNPVRHPFFNSKLLQKFLFNYFHKVKEFNSVQKIKGFQVVSGKETTGVFSFFPNRNLGVGEDVDTGKAFADICFGDF
jgi:hypothetical protein